VGSLRWPIDSMKPLTDGSHLLAAMHGSFNADLLVWQIGSLRALLDDAASREPELMERGSLDALHALMFRLIGEAMKRAKEPPKSDGSRGPHGRPHDAAGWELRSFALASVDALTEVLGGHGHKAEAQRFVAGIMTSYGVAVSATSYFDNAQRAKVPDKYPVDWGAVRRAAAARLREAHTRGEPIEIHVRAGVAMRCRVVQLLKRGEILYTAAGRVVP
jgi:hypothetical protein